MSLQRIPRELFMSTRFGIINRAARHEWKKKTTTGKRDSDRKVYQTGLQVRHFRVEERIVICAKETTFSYLRFCFQNWKVVNNIRPTHEEGKKNQSCRLSDLSLQYLNVSMIFCHARKRVPYFKINKYRTLTVLCYVVKHTWRSRARKKF